MQFVGEHAAIETKDKLALLGGDLSTSKKLVLCHINRYVTYRLHSAVFPCISSDEDIAFHDKARALEAQSPAYFGVKCADIDDGVCELAVERNQGDIYPR